VDSISGEPGNFKVNLVNRPRFIDPAKCTGCGECARACPVKGADEFNCSLSRRSATYIKYAQSVPLSYAIDPDLCIGCGLCEKVCIAGAIQYSDTVRESEVEAGSIIIAAGTTPFDPSRLDFLGYGTSPNILTSLEFERILSATGPYQGHLQRPLDLKLPRKIAWLQCVGSRDINRCGNGYCSSVCCMYAVKDAMIAKEHSHDPLDCAVFNMDMRTFGKDYEEYYNRAKKQGIRFEKARIHTVNPMADSGDLRVRYTNETGDICEEDFDMVVLSVGLRPSENTVEMAKRLGIDLNAHNFAKTGPFTPVETSRPGIFVCGAFQGPKDIPDSVTQASAAACRAEMELAPARNTRTLAESTPEETDISGEEPRIGVFVCKCGINIAGVVDVPRVVEYAKKLPYVTYCDTNLFTCSQDVQDNMKEIIRENRLNRVVVASCSPKTHEPIFMETLEACGLNRYLFEMANIRNQDSWSHTDSPEKATQKAIDLVRMAVARAGTLYPLHDKQIPVTNSGLVVGGGVAGMTAALALAEQGFEIFLVEQEAQLGGMALNLTKTIEGADIGAYLEELIEKVTSHPKIQVLTNSLIVNFSGFKGNFETEVLIGPAMYERKIKHGVVILATGATEYQPTEYLYGQNAAVVTQTELSRRLAEKGADDLEQVVMIQCVGSRDQEHPNCSRYCCQAAVKNALAIKKLKPDAAVYVLYRDMRTYGFLEDYFTEARRRGVLFFRYTPEEPPEVAGEGEGVTVTFSDHILGRRLSVTPDILALSAGMRPRDTEELGSIMKLGRNREGYMIEAHVKLRPVEMATEGIYVCGTAHSPRLIPEAISQALAAASRAATLLSKTSLTLSAVTAQVDQDKCASCLICVRNCPYNVPRINEAGVSEIDPALCQGCGVCAAECPAKAIHLNWYEDAQIMSKIDALLEEI
jgi:heterodisulfide reductase subunit A-like polyferredoxin